MIDAQAVEWKWLDDTGGALFIEGRKAATIWRTFGGWRVILDHPVTGEREVAGIADERTARDIALVAFDLPASRRYEVVLPDGVTLGGDGRLWWWVKHRLSGLPMQLRARETA